MFKMNPKDIEKLQKGIQRAFDTHDAAAFVHVGPFAEMLKDNPDRAIDMIFEVYNKALDDAYTDDEGKNVRAFIESIAGGPHEAIPSAVYNAVGEVYPYLERPQKDKALRRVLNILDGINYVYVQNSHTPFIREPLFLADISVCRWLYWPGVEDGIGLMKKYSTFEELKDETIDERGLFRRDRVRSDFVLATALMHGKYSQWGDNYIDVANPTFLDRVFKGIVAVDFARVPQEKLESRLKEFHEVWPERFKQRLDSIRQEKDWVDYTKFS